MVKVAVLVFFSLFVILFFVQPTDASVCVGEPFYSDSESCNDDLCDEGEHCWIEAGMCMGDYACIPTSTGDGGTCAGGHDGICSNYAVGQPFCDGNTLKTCEEGPDGCVTVTEEEACSDCEMSSSWGAPSEDEGYCYQGTPPSSPPSTPHTTGSSCSSPGSTASDTGYEECTYWVSDYENGCTEEQLSLGCTDLDGDQCDCPTPGHTFVRVTQTCVAGTAECIASANPTGSFTSSSFTCTIPEGDSTCAATISWGSNSDATQVKAFFQNSEGDWAWARRCDGSNCNEETGAYVRPSEYSNTWPAPLKLMHGCSGGYSTCDGQLDDGSEMVGECEAGTVYDAGSNTCVVGTPSSISITFSKTYDGPSASTFASEETIYGRIDQTQNVEGCGSSMSSYSSECSPSSSQWTGLPAGGWSVSDGQLRIAWSPASDVYPQGIYRTGARISTDNSVNDAASFSVVECTSDSHCSGECYSNSCRSCVDITGISVSDSEPLEDSTIELRCSASPSGHTNIEDSISGDGSCSFTGWDGSDATFDCDVGSPGSKTLTCGVQNRCQIGSDMTTTIEVQPSGCSAYGDSSSCSSAPESCEWCSGPECLDGQYKANAGSCVESGSCPTNRVCSVEFCEGTDDSIPARCDNDEYSDTCESLGYDGGSLDCNLDDSSSPTPLCMPYTGTCYNDCRGTPPANSVQGDDTVTGTVPTDKPSWDYTMSASPGACEFTCEDPTPVYDSDSNSCVGCQTDSDCSGEQVCNPSNSCEDVEVSLSVARNDNGDSISDGGTITECSNPEMSATCIVTPSGIGHNPISIDPACDGDENGWSCSDGDYAVTCDADGYDSSDSTSFRLNSPPAEISGIVNDENDSPVQNQELNVSLFKDGVMVNTSTQEDEAYSFVVDSYGEYVVTVTAEGFDLTSESVVVECGLDANQDLTLTTLSCTSDCTSGFGVCNYDCVGEGCSLDEDFFDDYAANLTDEYTEPISGDELMSELQTRCSGAGPGDRRAVPGYPGHYFVCCGAAGGSDPVREFGVVPVSVDSDARHLVSFTKIVNYDGLPVKMNVFVKGE